MKRIFCTLCAMALLLGGVMTTAFAAAAPTETPQAAEGDSNALEGVTEVPIPTPVPVPLYPAEVKQSEENGITRIEKIYYLSAQDDPSNIPTEDFEREGKTYKLLDVLKQAQIESDTQDYVEVLTLDSDTQDMNKILTMLEPELEVQTEDGYQGVLSLDHTTITVEAAGYKTSSRTVSATRTYPNLSGADVSPDSQEHYRQWPDADAGRCAVAGGRQPPRPTDMIWPCAIPPPPPIPARPPASMPPAMWSQRTMREK